MQTTDTTKKSDTGYVSKKDEVSERIIDRQTNILLGKMKNR